MRLRLTDRAVAGDKLIPPSGQQDHYDSALPGLVLRCSAGGTKTFTVIGRAHGRKYRVKLGTYPALGLADARKRAAQILTQADAGVDPRASRPAASMTFADAAVEFLDRHARPKTKPRTYAETVRLLGFKPDLSPAGHGPLREWGHRPVRSITRADANRILDHIADATPTQANRTRAALSKMFGWLVAREYVETNPVFGIPRPAAEKSRDRVLNEAEISAFWRATGETGWPFGGVFRLLLLTGCRLREIAELRWSEVDFEQRLISLPGSRTKNGRAHIVPLSPPAFEIVDDAPRIAGCEFVFSITGTTPVSGFTVAKGRLDRLMAAAIGEPLTAWRTHDLRRTCASQMAGLGINVAVIEAALNHRSGAFASVAGVYNRHDYDAEKRQALQALADRIMVLASDNVVVLNAAKGGDR